MELHRAGEAGEVLREPRGCDRAAAAQGGRLKSSGHGVLQCVEQRVPLFFPVLGSRGSTGDPKKRQNLERSSGIWDWCLYGCVGSRCGRLPLCTDQGVVCPLGKKCKSSVLVVRPALAWDGEAYAVFPEWGL